MNCTPYHKAIEVKKVVASGWDVRDNFYLLKKIILFQSLQWNHFCKMLSLLILCSFIKNIALNKYFVRVVPVTIPL